MNKPATNSEMLCKKLTAYFENVIAIGYNDSPTLKLVNGVKKAAKYDTCLVLFMRGSGIHIIENCDSLTLNEKTKQLFNRCTPPILDMEDLRICFDLALETVGQITVKQYYTLLANMVVDFLPSYMVITRKSAFRTLFQLRILESLDFSYEKMDAIALTN